LLCAAAAAFFFLRREKLPLLEAADLEKNHDIWRGHHMEDYDLKLRSEKDRLPVESFAAEVRGGKVTRLALNGNVLPQPSAAYSVEGLFDVLRRELEMAEEAEHAPGARTGAVLRCRFHPELGLPLDFKAIARQGKSFQITVEELGAPGRGTLFPEPGGRS
jgi:hypothetical protein